jgi:hypothetical protein
VVVVLAVLPTLIVALLAIVGGIWLAKTFS